MKPLIRWAGSKKKLLPELKRFMPEKMNKYYEPFCGSACLYFETMPDAAVLSDMNADLIDTYNMVKLYPIEIAEILSEQITNKENYLRIRSLDPNELSIQQKAARFIYLNKLCFNGVYRTNNKGQFNVPMGSKTGAIPDKKILIEYSQALKNATFISCDFEQAISGVKPNDFVYLDPPYSKPGNKYRGEYGPDCFTFEDISRLIAKLKELDSSGIAFALSYCECEVIREHLPQNWHVHSLSVMRHVAGFQRHRKLVDEVIISNRKPSGSSLR